MTLQAIRPRGLNGESNKLFPEDRAIHEWYRFVLSFPPHLVRSCLDRFGVDARHCVLDPFCGTGTVTVECKKLGIPSIGIEYNPMAYFASDVKVDWEPDPVGLIAYADEVAASTANELNLNGIDDVPVVDSPRASVSPRTLRTLPHETQRLLLKNSISPLPLHKSLVLLEAIDRHRDERYARHARLALAKVLVARSSNLHFGPEVGVGPPKVDAPVIAPWVEGVRSMANDLVGVRNQLAASATLLRGDSRQLSRILQPNSVDVVITSPPYPNEKDYTRATRLESVLLGFIRNRADLRALKSGLMRSNTRNVYKGDDDDRWVSQHPEIQRIADEIEARRLELEKTSGFERLYARVTKLYFGGMARHLADLRGVLRPGAKLAYVVGDQGSYLRVMIQTGRILAEIGESLGYEVVGIDLFRTRLATSVRQQLREEVVVLRWPGGPALGDRPFSRLCDVDI